MCACACVTQRVKRRRKIAISAACAVHLHLFAINDGLEELLVSLLVVTAELEALPHHGGRVGRKWVLSRRAAGRVGGHTCMEWLMNN